MALTGPSAPLIGKPLGDQRIEFRESPSDRQRKRLQHKGRARAGKHGGAFEFHRPSGACRSSMTASRTLPDMSMLR